jgi:hypothetical protein
LPLLASLIGPGNARNPHTLDFESVRLLFLSGNASTETFSAAGGSVLGGTTKRDAETAHKSRGAARPRRGSTSSRRKGRPGALLPSGTGSRDWLALGNACARRVQVLLPALPNVGGGPLQRRRSYYLSAGSPRQFGAYRCPCSKFRGCTRMARCATRQRPPVTLRRLCRSNDDPERASAAWRVCVHPIARSKSAAGRQHRHHSDGDRALSLAEVSCPPPPSPPRKDADPSLLRGHSM